MKKAMMLILCFLSFHAMAQSKPFEAGEYITEGGWGVMNIGPFENGHQSFEIFAVGGNFHTCDLSGKIDRHVGATEGGGCEIVFYRNDNGIEVVVDDEMYEACRSNCGNRASFAGHYLKPSQGCERGAMKQAVDRSDELVRQGSYAEAESILRELLSNCQTTLMHYEDGHLRNELAEIQAELNLKQACFQTLQPWTDLANKTDEAVCRNPPIAPAECDEVLSIVSKVRTNIVKCAALPE
ncbi:hypothetical protein CUZ56_01751 [Saezia sanguinis]|uniref:Secreted protein n=1 Tax=Saezia sanguinis TaxID=1965230 RepID=A0A433SCK4_9BURK|nr:hypothetical protein [Saezia sanguinis]RUS66471.1 hypothetical protein CUZ56_01751 [Saezia sanguinis]